jgi:glucose/arabinose dehydrogenase
MRVRAGLAGALALVPVALGAGAARAAVALQQIGTFAQPVYVAAPARDVTRVLVVEKAGRIQLVRGGVTSLFLDLTDRVVGPGSSERGLLSMAFAPDYATSGKFYVYYTAAGGDLVIAEYQRRDADHGDPATFRQLLRIPHGQYANHNGGQLQFGPDGMLWIGTGDGGGANDPLGNAPRTDAAWTGSAPGRDARLGKLLRIDPAPGDGCDGGCTIPADNPGFGQREIWAYGLRNPWRYSFDRQTGDLVVGDVGQAAWEEVDFLAAPGRGAGANLGWDTYEGRHVTGSSAAPASLDPSFVWPVLEKSHAAPDNFVALTGGYVVRDPALPDLAGRYLYADTYGGDIRAVTLSAGGATGDTATGLHVSMLSSFGEDGCGRVYATSLDGPVYRLTQSGACVPPPEPAPGTAAAASQGGGGAGGSGGGAASGTGAAADRTAPVVRLSAAARQYPWRSGVVRLRVGCDEACTVTAGGRFSIRALRTATVRMTLPAGTSRTLTLKVTAPTRRALLRALRRHRRVLVSFSATATDTAGNAGKATSRSSLSLRRT